jgi:voltage-gated potassium channel
MMRDLFQFAFPFIALYNIFRHLTRQPEFRALLGVEVVLIASGTVFYHYVENWAWVDALYFCVVTLATVGYGDLHPTTTWAKLFTIPYIILGVALLGVFIQIAGRTALETLEERARTRARKTPSGDRTQGETK